MKYLAGLVSLLLLQNFLCFGQADKNFGIIPAPKSITQNQGKFIINAQTLILCQEASEKIAFLFKDFVQQKTGFNLTIIKNDSTQLQNSIKFDSDSIQNISSEAYTLNTDAQTIRVNGKEKGLFYAVQTLFQLINQYQTQLPALNICDEPRYTYRGLHLDVSRHFYPISFIKQYLDLMAMYKLNNFHWHLTDDQGWRMEIKKYPRLTQIGGYRSQTIIGNYHDRMPQWFDNTPYGGYYTQQEIKEIVAYADTKFINIVPEIDMPGHSLAALVAYPHLACNKNPGPFKTAERWGGFDDIFCAGKDSTFIFMEDVLTEVMQLFPSKFIHIGGDEVLKTKWKTCLY
ncbi:MAG: beta-N-acetylhexosaminidase, partial [Sphingobacteriales bacterium]